MKFICILLIITAGISYGINQPYDTQILGANHLSDPDDDVLDVSNDKIELMTTESSLAITIGQLYKEVSPIISSTSKMAPKMGTKVISGGLSKIISSTTFKAIGRIAFPVAVGLWFKERLSDIEDWKQTSNILMTQKQLMLTLTTDKSLKIKGKCPFTVDQYQFFDGPMGCVKPAKCESMHKCCRCPPSLTTIINRLSPIGKKCPSAHCTSSRPLKELEQVVDCLNSFVSDRLTDLMCSCESNLSSFPVTQFCYSLQAHPNCQIWLERKQTKDWSIPMRDFQCDNLSKIIEDFS